MFIKICTNNASFFGFTEASLETECNKLDCKYGCKNISAVYKCICEIGYNLQTDNKTCDGRRTYNNTVDV